MRRIVIIGTSCSGKTTLARDLARRLGNVHVEMDALHWGPNWTPNSDFLERVRDALSADRWVTDGNYGKVRTHLWERADTLIWLDYSARVVFGRALRRTIMRSWNQSELWSGNRESFYLSFCSRDSILIWVWSTWRRRRRDYPKLLREQVKLGKRVIRFRTPQETEQWLRHIADQM